MKKHGVKFKNRLGIRQRTKNEFGLQLLKFIKETVKHLKQKEPRGDHFRSSGSGSERLHIIYCGVRSTKHPRMLHLDLAFESSGVSHITRTKGLISKRNLTTWRRVNCGHGRYRVLSRNRPKRVVGASRPVTGQLAGASVLGWWWRWRMRGPLKRRV